LITKEIKAKAIARLKHLIPVEQIAEELELPTNLITEWKNGLDTNDLVKIESTIQAVDIISRGELLEYETTLEKLDETLKRAAVELSGLIISAADYDHSARSMSVNLCSEALTKLYKTFYTITSYTPPPY